jgi:hypothetical protein
MESRVAKLEALAESTDRQRADFRMTFAAGIAVALGLAGLMAKGVGWH